MGTKYKKYVICETCQGLGKVEKVFEKEDEPKEEKGDENAKE